MKGPRFESAHRLRLTKPFFVPQPLLLRQLMSELIGTAAQTIGIAASDRDNAEPDCLRAALRRFAPA